MKKRSGLSTMGYAIVLVIILAIVMIMSAPMLVNKYESDNKTQNKEDINEEETNSSENDYNRYIDENLINITDEMHNIESRLSSRIDGLEMQLNNPNSSSSGYYNNSTPEPPISDRYICEIEGVKNEYGNTVPLTNESDITTQKIVFVCEYRR